MKIKNHFLILSLFCLPLFLLAQNDSDQESTGLPGDHFSLEGALELFKKAESPENFEKLLNTEDNYVNNLDLNEDGEIDYIRVVDNMEGDVHAMVLQVPLSDSESQDVAVIEIEQTGKEEAILQIIGDETLFGQETIVEPFDVETKDDGRGPMITVDRIVFNVYFWPSVRYVYRPGYRVYVSSFRWRHYPVWWKPWRPYAWHRYHARRAVYKPHYRVVTTHRVVKAHRVYMPHRRTSKVVRTRTVKHTTVKGKNASVTRTTTSKSAGVKKNKGAVGAKKTTTRTTVKGPKGGTVTKKKQTTSVGKKGKGGAVGGKRTNTTVRKKRGG